MPKIEDAIVDFIKNYGTFYASMLSQMTRIEDNKNTETIKVAIKNGRVILKYNSDWFNPRTMKDGKALLEHECLHIAMDHHARAKDKDLQLWKLGCDLAINQMLTHVPADALTIDKLFEPYSIDRNETAEYYYEKLKKDSKAKQKAQTAGNGGCSEEFEHGSDGESEMDSELTKEVVKQLIKEAHNTVKNNPQMGKLPMGLEHYLAELFSPPKVSWKTILRKLVSNSIKSGKKASWKKPSRRYGATQKGKVADRTISLVVAIDTSGSIDDGMLNEFIAEIKSIQACYKSDIHMIECDAAVGKYYKLTKYAKVDRKLSGRGGTDFAPVFEYVKQKGIRCDALIYFTDLRGSFPSKRPPYPTIWGHYSGGWSNADDSRVPFGYVIKLEKEKKK